jgi:hypothetical protein
MVTEADARSLEYGSTIVLVAGGHITPLARDTLTARRISVEAEGGDPESARLAPAADVRTVAVAGIGSAIAANKVAGARAAMCLSDTLARYARQHNGANVLALGAMLITKDQAISIVNTFIDTPMREPRYIRRLAKIRDLELRSGS